MKTLEFIRLIPHKQQRRQVVLVLSVCTTRTFFIPDNIVYPPVQRWWWGELGRGGRGHPGQGEGVEAAEHTGRAEGFIQKR